MKASASAPGKVILVGEHFVVEGSPAIAVAVDVRARATAEAAEGDLVTISSRELGEASFGPGAGGGPLYPVYVAVQEIFKRAGRRAGLRLTIESDIPPGAGMGSSAAVAAAAAAATARLLGLPLSPDEIAQAALAAETIVHGKPSGIDPAATSYGGAIYFKRGAKPERISADFGRVRLVLADSGIQRSTGALVARVLETKRRHPEVLEPLYKAAANLAEKARSALERGDFATVGELMNINHGMLSALGVSNAKLEELVYAAREAGALGAKITGAGGGGMIVALCWSEDAERVARALSGIAARTIVAPVSEKGATSALEG